MTANGDFECVNAKLGDAAPAGQHVLTDGPPVLMYGCGPSSPATSG
ncbi:MAG: hypothetical protein ABW137_34570 [Mycobacterium sp.]